MWSPRRFKGILVLLGNRFFLLGYCLYRLILTVLLTVELFMFKKEDKIRLVILILMLSLSVSGLIFLIRFIYSKLTDINDDIVRRNYLRSYLQVIAIVDTTKTMLFFTFMLFDWGTLLTFALLSVTLPINFGLKYIHNSYYLQLVPAN